MPEPFQFIVLSSPSGTGKTTLARMIVADTSLGKYCFSVSHTTRPPRENETDGVDYYFVSHAQFEKIAREGGFAESARVHGNRYGTSIAEIERCRSLSVNGIIFDIDYQGARQLKRKFPETLAIFLLPPSIEELKRRLKQRGTESRWDLEVRLKNAVKEMAHFKVFDFIIVNDKLERTYQAITTVITAHRYSQPFGKELVKRLIEEAKVR